MEIKKLFMIFTIFYENLLLKKIILYTMFGKMKRISIFKYIKTGK